MAGPSGVGEGRAGAMLTVLDRLSLPGSPERPNEDAFGVAGNWAWILDGSIAPGHAPIMGEASDAVWLVRFAGERFAALAPGAADGRALIAWAIGEAPDAFLARAPNERRDPVSWPAAALTLVRASGGRIEAWTLADTVAVVRDANGAVATLNEAPALRTFESGAVSAAGRAEASMGSASGPKPWTGCDTSRPPSSPAPSFSSPAMVSRP
jgi:hypothetical protein